MLRSPVPAWERSHIEQYLGDHVFRVLRAGAVALTAAIIMTIGIGGVSADEPDPVPPTTLADELAAAAAEGAAGAVELAAAVGLPIDGPNSLTVDPDGNLAVTVTFERAPTQQDLDALAGVARVDRVFRFSPAVAVTSAPQDLPALAALPGVRSVVPIVEGRTSAVDGGAPLPAAPLAAAPLAAAPGPLDDCRAIPVDADAPERTKEARQTFGVDGTGITIGIISDSFHANPDAVTTPEQDVALGVLPGPGNPCGWETPVRVLSDWVTGGDEGRAMAQLVHGIAPGAALVFATGWGGPNGMADAIIALADAGADVIVDDLGFSTETYYQQGLVSLAINEVRARGVAYYSAVGNGNVVGKSGTSSEGKPIGAWQTSAYRAMECPDWISLPEEVVEYDCLDFDPGIGSDATDGVVLNGAATPQFLLSWAEPVNGVTSSFTLQLYTDEETPELVNSSSLYDAAIPNESLGFAQRPPAGGYQFVVVRDLTDRDASEPALWFGVFSGGSAVTSREHDESQGEDVVGPVTYGHPADGSAVGVAAAYWATSSAPESFSSPGPGLIMFEPYDPFSPDPSAPYAEPIRTQAPRITGVDGSQTSFFDELDNGAYRFYGTSAAAPNVAAVHALALDFSGGTAEQVIVDLMTSTAAAMTNPYAGYLADEDVFGAGLIDAVALLAALPPGPVSGVVATAMSSTSIAVEWDALPGAEGYVVELVQESVVVDTATPGADQTTALFTGLTEGEAYRARVAAVNADDERGPWTDSLDVELPPPPHPPLTPPAPDEDSLVPGTQGDLTATPASAVAGGTVTVYGLPGLSWVHGWAYSDPVALGWVWTASNGTATFTIPAGLPAGTHRVAVTDAEGALLGWITLQVTASGAVVLPQTGPAGPVGAVAFALAALLAGCGLAVAAGMRRRGGSVS